MKDRIGLLERLNTAETPEEILPDLLLMFAVELESLRKKIGVLEKCIELIQS